MDAPANSSALRRRIVTGTALIAGFLVTLYLASDEIWAVLMILVAMAAAWEWGGLIRLPPARRHLYTGLTALACGALVVTGAQLTPYPFLAALLFWVIAAPLWLYRGLRVLDRRLLAALGWLILLPAVLVVVIADSAAYFAGRRFGRRKLAPAISPGKTWEGAMGAALAITVYALAVHALWPRGCGLSCLPQLLLAFWAMFVLSVLGDLFESWIKRQAGVKDSGALLPGHGGVLDRIDSLTAVLPAATLFWMWLK
ncbi:MAG: phosphatidate cytidylyltransferase [Thiobacillaceae bacterium]|nr:phosphatidate cytidylyltransferase [Thiobacillaceae bacterium]